MPRFGGKVATITDGIRDKYRKFLAAVGVFVNLIRPFKTLPQYAARKNLHETDRKCSIKVPP